MQLKDLKELDIQGKTILYRAPYNIEPEIVGGILQLKDDLRIKASVPTIQYLLTKNCRIIILAYVGRPDGKVVEELRTTLHAEKLSELLGIPVAKIDECTGPQAEARVSKMKAGEILMLENVRFHGEEMSDDDNFARELCKGKDLIVFDAFPDAHRQHASTTGIERHLPAVPGFYLKQEVEMLSNLLENPKRPFTVIIGGAKISDKVDAVNNLLNLADKVLVGGAVSNVFLKARGLDMGSSFIEDVFVDEKKREKKNWVSYAGKIIEVYQDKIVYPVDLMISDGTSVKVVGISTSIPNKWMTQDIGPQTQESFAGIIENSGTTFFAGPMGKFENKEFAIGSSAILKAMKNSSGVTIIAGGDTIDVARKYSNLSNFSHVSLAGGATLEFLAGKELPALKALTE